jgi:uncharacterized protein
VPEIPPLPASTILLVEVGSTAHGTGIPGGEDHDEMGVVIEPAAAVLGLGETGLRSVMQRTQPEGVRSGPGDTDRTLHSLRRFVRLAAGGNPSILMCLWAPVLHSTAEGEQLRDLGPAFVGRHVIPRYRGYMQAQALRLLGRRGGGQRPELLATHGWDTKFAMHAARLGFQCLELVGTGRLELPIGGEPAEWLRAVRRGEVPFEEWWARCLDLDARMAAALADDRVPEGPQRARIEEWLVRTHLAQWTDGATD